ncbi:MAG: TatD family hydrolase [candidate division Zixibacteria bacterium]|nr:TatD family hydrolase [candidate division Zixibacteria bacterium]
MQLIDTHCHLTFEQLADDVEGVVARSEAAGVTGWITVGTDPQQNRTAVEFAERFENMYAALGIHPHDAKDVTGETLTELKELAQSEKVVALGETGLDFHYDFSNRTDQKRAFAAQLEIAKELNLPVIVHCREAFDETMDILQQFLRLKGQLKGVVFHCFGGSAEQARIVLNHGFYISFTGVVTFKNAETTRQAAKVVPVDRLMLETDCPYMSPEPMRKQKINEPALMIHTARFLAGLKEMELPDFAEAVTAASKDFFGLP